MENDQVLTITVPLNQNSLVYNRNSYEENKDNLLLFITKDAYNDIFEQLNKVMGRAFSEKLSHDEIKKPKHTGVLNSAVLLLTVLFPILLGYAVSLSSDFLFAVAVVTIISALSLCVFLMMRNFFRYLGKFRSLEDFIKTNVEHYLNVLNKTLINVEFYIDHSDLSIKIKLFYPKKKKYEGELDEIMEHNETEQRLHRSESSRREESNREGSQKNASSEETEPKKKKSDSFDFMSYNKR